MTTNIDTGDICCAALELSKTSWVCAFAVPGDSQVVVHKIKAGDVDRLIGILNSSKAKAEHRLGRPLQHRSLLRGRLRWLLACPASECAQHPHDCVRSGEFPDAAPWPPGQD